MSVHIAKLSQVSISGQEPIYKPITNNILLLFDLIHPLAISIRIIRRNMSRNLHVLLIEINNRIDRLVRNLLNTSFKVEHSTTHLSQLLLL